MKLEIKCATPLVKFNSWEVRAIGDYIRTKCESWPTVLELAIMTGVHPVVCGRILHTYKILHRPNCRKLKDYLD